jgi:hypothetical protein
MVVTSVANAADRSGKIAISLSVETLLDVEMELIGGVEKDISLGVTAKSPKFEIIVSNAGNVESEFLIFSSGGMRGWNVILSFETGADCEKTVESHLLCTLPEGESIIVYAKVTLPGGDAAEVEDSFTFTISAEPSETGLVGRENLELTVNGQPAESAIKNFFVKVYNTPSVLVGIGAVVLLGFAFLALRRRN